MGSCSTTGSTLLWVSLSFRRKPIYQGGIQGQKSCKLDFEITGDPKGPPSGPTFWSGFEVQTHELWGHAFLGPKKSKMANNAQNRDKLTPIDR